MDLESNLEEMINSESFGSKKAESLYFQYNLKKIEDDLIKKYFTKLRSIVLDIGCGYGRTTKILHERGFSVVGIDIVKKMIDCAKIKNPQIDYRLMSATKIDFPDNYFDYALFSFNGIDFIYPEERRLEALREIHRVLKPGGIFIMSTHNRASYFFRIFTEFNKNCLLTLLRNLLKFRLLSSYWWSKHVEGDLIFFSQTVDRQINELLNSGFSLEEIRGRNFLSGWKLKFLEPWPYYVLRKEDTYKIIQTKQSYSFNGYVDFDRWASYFYQLREVISLAPKNMLEVGVGDNVVGSYLENNFKIKYTSVDIDPNLSPSVVSGIDNLPFGDNYFEIVLACEVLEHLPFDRFSVCLEEIRRVSSKYVIISLPHFGPPIRFCFKMPFLTEIKFALKLPWPQKHVFNGQHYWEIGKIGFGRIKIRKELKKHFLILKEFVPFENQYHRFYVLQKK